MRSARTFFALINAPPPRIETAADAVRVIGHGLAEATEEVLRLAYLDDGGTLMGLDERPGGPAMLPIALGQILRDICSQGATRLLIAHNHPSGNPMPSEADRAVTRQLAELMRTIEGELVDHLIFARGGVASFRAMGLL